MAKRLLFIALGIVLFCGGVWGDETARTIVVEGSAIVKVVPDRISITISVATTGPSPITAYRSCKKASDELLKTIRSFHIDNKDIQTSMIGTSPHWDPHQEEIVNYDATTSYSVTLKDTATASDFIEHAVESGANYLNLVEYSNSQMRKYQDEARGMAVRAAKEKADALAAQLNCRVGRPISIIENVGYSAAISANNANSSGNAGPAQHGDLAMPSGQMQAPADVSVTFELLDAPPASAPPATRP